MHAYAPLPVPKGSYALLRLTENWARQSIGLTLQGFSW